VDPRYIRAIPIVEYSENSPSANQFTGTVMDRPGIVGDLHESRSTKPRDEDHVLSEALRPTSGPDRDTMQDVASSSTRNQPLQSTAEPTAEPAVGCTRCGYLGAPLGQSCQECGKTTELDPDVATNLREQGINSFILQNLPAYNPDRFRASVGYVSSLGLSIGGTESDDNDEHQSSSNVVADIASSKSKEMTKAAADATSSESRETTELAASIQSTDTVIPVNKRKEIAMPSSASINSTTGTKSTASIKSFGTIMVSYKGEERASSASASTKFDETAKRRGRGKRRASSVSEGPFTKYNREVEAQQQKHSPSFPQRLPAEEPRHASIFIQQCKKAIIIQSYPRANAHDGRFSQSFGSQ
jgi:hypothetical protein